MFTSSNTYCYTVVTSKFMKVDRAGQTLVVRIILGVGRVEDVEVVMIRIVAAQDIGNEFQQRGLSNTSLPDKNYVVWRFFHVILCLDDPLHEGVYIARKYGQYMMHKNRRRNLLISWAGGVNLGVIFQGVLAWVLVTG